MTLANILSTFVKPRSSLNTTLLVRNLTNVQRKPKSSTVKARNNKVLIDGVELNWKKFGNGPHVALFCPGLVGSIAENVVPVANKMNLNQFTLIGWDPPGYGRSRPPNRDIFTSEFSLAKDARLAGCLMKELGYDKYSVVGWSNGGMTGALIAASSPETVDKVVMCNTPLKYNDHSRKIMELMVDLDTWTKSQRKGVMRTYEKSYLQKMLNDWKQFVDHESTNDDFSNYFFTQIESIRVPILYIKSMEDVVVPNEDVEEYGKSIKNFSVHAVAKGGHEHLDFLDDFVAATESFLRA